MIREILDINEPEDYSRLQRMNTRSTLSYSFMMRPK